MVVIAIVMIATIILVEDIPRLHRILLGDVSSSLDENDVGWLRRNKSLHGLPRVVFPIRVTLKEVSVRTDPMWRLAENPRELLLAQLLKVNRRGVWRFHWRRERARKNYLPRFSDVAWRKVARSPAEGPSWGGGAKDPAARP